MAEKLVVALGGNALQSRKSDGSAEAQLEVVKETCKSLAKLSKLGYEMGIVHGNGPQVGAINLAYEAAKEVTPAMPFDVCGAMSQGYIGYHLCQALRKALHDLGVTDAEVATIVSQVVVDKDDPAFQNPTKPIGPFMTEEEALKLAEEKGFTVREDAGRGWRRVVASPVPTRVLEVPAIKTLWPTTITISNGGGGVPVVETEPGVFDGVAAVIDKDLAAELLAESIEADVLMILTEVERVAINFGKPDQQDLSEMSLADVDRYIEEGQFAPGSMLPKVNAAKKFVQAFPDKIAIIAALDKAEEALQGKSGTVIHA